MGAKLKVFVEPGCESCKRALHLVEQMCERFPALEVEVSDLSRPGADRPDDVFAVPTFALNDHLLSLGNPGRSRLIAAVEAALNERGAWMTSRFGRILRRPTGAKRPTETGGRGEAPIPKGAHGPSPKVSYLRETDLFRDLSSTEMKEIDRMTSMTTCRRGKVFYAPGETGEVLFILKRGRVNVYRMNPDGKKLVTASVEAGTVFGEMSLIGQGMHDSFAEAAEDCTLCVMSRSDVEYLLTSKPALALRVIEIMAHRLNEAEERLESTAFKSVPARLASTLLQLWPGGGRVIEGISHQELADMVGTYRETVTRVLNDFQGQGFIEVGRRRIRLLQPDRLAGLAEE